VRALSGPRTSAVSRTADQEQPHRPSWCRPGASARFGRRLECCTCGARVCWSAARPAAGRCALLSQLSRTTSDLDANSPAARRATRRHCRRHRVHACSTAGSDGLPLLVGQPACLREPLCRWQRCRHSKFILLRLIRLCAARCCGCRAELRSHLSFAPRHPTRALQTAFHGGGRQRGSLSRRCAEPRAQARSANAKGRCRPGTCVR
jgi:hypothetical protein